MFEYRRVDFLFVLTAVKFWLQIGWGKVNGQHMSRSMLGQHGRIVEAKWRGRAIFLETIDKLTIIDIFLDGFKSWPYLGGWTSRIYTMFWEDLIIFKSWTSVKTQRMNIRCRTAALPQDVRAGWRAHRGLVGCICRSAELTKLMAAQGTKGTNLMRETLSHYIPQKIPI